MKNEKEREFALAMRGKSQCFNITVQNTSQDGNGNSQTATMCHTMCSFQETIEKVMLELKWWLKNEEGVSCFRDAWIIEIL